MSNYQEIAKQILSAVGNEENVTVVNHCATRLRLTITNKNNVSESQLKMIEGVLGTVFRGNELQIIIGTDVGNVYNAFQSLGSFQSTGKINENLDKGLTEDPQQLNTQHSLKKNLLKIVDFISGTFVPVLPILVAAGLVSAVLNIAVTFFGLPAEGGTYTILTAVNNAGFYFLPIYLGFSAAKKIGIEPMLGAYLGGILLHSSIDGAKGLDFLSIPVPQTTYSSSVIPIILGVLFMYLIYKTIDKFTPKEIKYFINPLVTILIVTPVTLIILGPLGAFIGQYIADILGFVNDKLGWFSVGLIGAVTPLLVMTGTNQALFPLVFATMANLGYDNFVMPGMLAANVAIGAAAIAISFSTRNTDKRALSLSAGITGVVGITEPSIFGVLLVFKSAFIGAVAGGTIGGLFAGLVHLKQYAVVSPGIAAIPTFIPTNGAGINANFWFSILTILIAFGSSFVITYILEKQISRALDAH